MPFSEARRTLARKKRFSGSLDYRMSNVKPTLLRVMPTAMTRKEEKLKLNSKIYLQQLLL